MVTPPLRVAHVSFHADAERRNGTALLDAWPTLSSVATAVSSAGVDVVVVQTAHADETIERNGVAYHFVNDARRMRSRVIARVRAESPHVVHVHGFHSPLAIWQLANALPRVPVLVQDHGSPLPTGWRRPVWRWALRPTAGAAFTVEPQAEPWRQARVLGRDVPVFEALESSTNFTIGDREAARRTTGMFGDPCVLWTGRLNENKDPLTMLAAFEIAAASLSDARLWCCFGESPLLDVVRGGIAESDVLRERVVLLGARPHAEMEQRFRAADFYMQTSHHEAAGFALIEALACGATPIVTDIPPARRIVGNAGSLTPIGDAPSMARALVDWARRDRATLRCNARAQFEETLTFASIGRDLRKTYETLAASCAP
jgi:glycosyltransferase involved in cell wall biosynthesis